MVFARLPPPWRILLLFAALPVSAHSRPLPPFRLGVNTQIVFAGFELSPISGESSSKLKYRPADSRYAGLILGYRWLGGTLAFGIPAPPEIRALEGISRYRDYRVTLYFRKFGAELSYNRYMGYLIENSSDLSSSTLNGEQYYKIPDLETLGYGASFFYIPNPGSFSLPAALDQSAVQEKSAGALLFLATWREQIISSGSPLIPEEKRASFGSDQLIRRAEMGSYALGLGYAFHWVPSIFFASPLLALTAGYQRAKYDSGESTLTSSSIGVNVHARLGVGVNIPNFFLTGGFYTDVYGNRSQTIRISNMIYGFIFSIGGRI